MHIYKVRTGGIASNILPSSVTSNLNDNAITAEMLAKDFCLKSECLEAYAITAGEVAGAAAASAACSTIGIPGILCAPIGKFLGNIITKGIVNVIKAIPIASGQTMREFIVEELKSENTQLKTKEGERWPQVWENAPLRIMAALTYQAERTALIDSVRINGQMTPQQADNFLTERGVPSLTLTAPLVGWSGTQERWGKWVDLGFENDGANWSNPNSSYYDGIAELLFGFVNNYNVYQAQMLMMFPGGPPSPPGELDFGLIGEDPKAIYYAEHGQSELRKVAPSLLNYRPGFDLIDPQYLPGGDGNSWISEENYNSKKSKGKAIALSVGAIGIAGLGIAIAKG